MKSFYSPANDMALIEARDLEKTYHNGGVSTPALRGVSFSVEAGEFLAIMGPSGSGKSTLLHILGFLDRHTKGRYRFDGKTIDDYSPVELAHVRNEKMGFVFQAFNLLPRATVLENVKLPLLYSSRPESDWRELALKAVETVDLVHRINYESSRLSGGEKQRVAIARALVLKPQVIFADEPTGNLDSAAGQRIIEIIKKLNKEYGHTVILITHETYMAEEAGRIIRLHDGRIISDGEAVQRRHTGNQPVE